MKPITSWVLHATGEGKWRNCITNNPELAEKELNRLGYTSVEYSMEARGELDEIIYFDEEGNVVPLDKLLAPNNYK